MSESWRRRRVAATGAPPPTRGRRRWPTSCPDGTPFSIRQLIDTLPECDRRVGSLEIEDLWQGLETVVHFEEAFRQIVALEQN
jgi:hypothetical protein